MSGETCQLTQFYVNRALKVKMCFIPTTGRNILAIFKINGIFIWTPPPARTAKYMTKQKIFHKNIFDLILLITCADAIFIDHLLC